MPHPERTSPQLAPMVRDDEIERIAVREAIKHEEARGWVVESVETENRGFDLISRRPHPEDPKTFIEVRFIEVKGRAGVGVIALSENEYDTAVRLKNDYWLYAVFNCAGTPQLHTVQNPAGSAGSPSSPWNTTNSMPKQFCGQENERQENRRKRIRFFIFLSPIFLSKKKAAAQCP